MKAKPVQVVYGPGTFLNQAVAAVNLAVTVAADERPRRPCRTPRAPPGSSRWDVGSAAQQADAAAKAAGTLEGQRQLQQLERLYLDSGITGTPRIDNAQFIDQIVFDPTRGAEPAEVAVRVPVPEPRARR